MRNVMLRGLARSGAMAATMAIISLWAAINGSAHEVRIVPLNGRPTPVVLPGDHTTHTPLDFGALKSGQSSTRTTTITNTTTETLTIRFGLPSSDFAISPQSLTLGAAGSASDDGGVTITWSPSHSGKPAKPLTLLTTHSRARIPARSSIPISGTATSDIQLSATSLDFGLIDVHAPASKPLVITNNSSSPVAVTLSNSSWEFSVSPATAQTLGPKGSGTESLTYTVTLHAGSLETTFNGLLTVTGTISGQTPSVHRLPVTGRFANLGGPAGIFGNTFGIHWGVVRAGAQLTQTIAISNKSEVDPVIATFTAPPGIAVSPQSIELGTAPPSSQSQVEVSWGPTGNTTLDSVLTARTYFPGITEPVIQTKALSGWSKSYPTFAPATFAFGNVTHGTSKSIPVTITNSGPDTVTVNFSLGGGLSIHPNNLTLGLTDEVFGSSSSDDINVAAGTSRTIDLIWSPSPTSYQSLPSTMELRTWYPDTRHAQGFHEPLFETWPLSGIAVTPADLVLRDRTTHAIVTDIDLTTMTAGTDWLFLDRYEFFNRGQSALSNDVRTDGLSPVFVGGGQACSEPEAIGFCIAPSAIIDLVSALRNLPAGQALPVTMQFRGAAPGELEWPFSIVYDGGRTLPLRARGKVVPWLSASGSLTASTARRAVSTNTTTGGDYTIDVMGPRLARGFGADKIFHNAGDLDSVNLLNGNLTATIPIGGPQVVSDGLSYSLVLIYNSNVWDRWKRLYQGSAQQVELFAPTPSTNAGSGWSLHLGRLCEPTDWAVWQDIPEAERERLPCRNNYWRYTSPDGAQHEFDGSGPNKQVLYNIDRPAQLKQDYLYARDGSYMRLHRVDATTRELEFPNGVVHVFKYDENWGDQWDAWRLTSMRDGYGNTVTVSYSKNATEMTWTLSDCRTDSCASGELRTNKIYLAKQTGGFYDYRVSRVTLAGVGNAARTYTFHYDDVTTDRPYSGGVDPGGAYTVPLLKAIDVPGQAGAFLMKYLAGLPDLVLNTRLNELQIPTRARIQYTYDTVILPMGSACANNDGSSSITQLKGVVHRQVLGETGTKPIEESRYRYELRLGTGFPTLDYCRGNPIGSPPQAPTPDAARITAVIIPTARDAQGQATQHKLSLNYFSVFPITIGGQAFNPLHSYNGWTGAEFGLPFTRDVKFNAAGDEFFLSSALYAIASLPQAFTIDNLTNGHTPLRRTFVRYELLPKHCDHAEICPPANARRAGSLEVFDDDAGHWRKTIHKNHDGLGHFRRTEVTADSGWSAELFSSYRNWNPGVGTLTSSFTTVSDVTPPAKWFLGVSTEAFVKVGDAARRSTEQCWETSGNAIRLKRTRRNANASAGNHDLITQYSYDSKGRLTKEEFFGGDSQTTPADAGWCTQSLGTPQYVRNHTFSFVTRPTDEKVERRTSAFSGGPLSTDEDLDLWTGLPIASRDIGGRETTYAYDSRDLPIDRIHPIDATQHLDYEIGSTNRFTASTHLKGTPVSALTKSEVTFDDLGRPFIEREQLPDGAWSKSGINYDPAGRTESVTTVQPDATWSNAHKYVYEYDVLDRPVKLTKPDGAVVTMSYAGERETSYVTQIGTTFTADGGNGTITDSSAKVTRSLDPFGRVITVEAPLYTTTFTYDSTGNPLTATRGTQTRTYNRDGRGLLLSETHPETGAVTYSNFDALGNTGLKSDGHSVLQFEFDAAGRPTRTLEPFNGKGLVQELFYYTSGDGLGQLERSERYQDLESADVAGDSGMVGKWTVAEDFAYGSDGRVSTKTLAVLRPDGTNGATFDQTWTYTPLGQIATMGHPRCLNPASPSCNGMRRTTTSEYGAGQLTRIISPNQMGASFAYHANGLLASITHDDGSVSSYGVAAHFMPRISSVNVGGYDLGSYGYDGSGNLVSQGAHRYVYDKLGRLRHHHQSGTLVENYTYTDHDVLSSIDGDPLGTDIATNRLSGESYTGAGQQTSDTSSCATMSWDALGSMRSYVRSSGCGKPAAAYAMLYSAAGHRVLVTGTEGSQWEIRGDGGKLLTTFEGSGSTLRLAREYVQTGLTPITSRDADGTVSHLHADHLGTVRGITRNGTLLTRRYDPYGTLVTPSNHGEVLDFAGHEKDPNDDSVYMQARTYDAAAARFFSPDPARTGWNLYAYANNRPVNRIDPDGRDDVDAKVILEIIDSARQSTMPVAVIGNGMDINVTPTTDALNAAAAARGADIKFVNFNDLVDPDLIAEGRATDNWWPAQNQFNSRLAAETSNVVIVAPNVRLKPGEFLESEFMTIRTKKHGAALVAAERLGRRPGKGTKMWRRFAKGVPILSYLIVAGTSQSVWHFLHRLLPEAGQLSDGELSEQDRLFMKVLLFGDTHKKPKCASTPTDEGSQPCD